MKEIKALLNADECIGKTVNTVIHDGINCKFVLVFEDHTFLAVGTKMIVGGGAQPWDYYKEIEEILNRE